MDENHDPRNIMYLISPSNNSLINSTQFITSTESETILENTKSLIIQSAHFILKESPNFN